MKSHLCKKTIDVFFNPYLNISPKVNAHHHWSLKSIYTYIYIYIYIYRLKSTRTVLLLYTHPHTYAYTHIYIYMLDKYWHNDKRCIKDAWRKEDAGTIEMQAGRHKKTSLTKYIPLTLFVRFAFERMLETEHKHHILTPLLWPSRCVLFSWCWGPLHLHLVSNPLGVCWQLLLGFSECPLGRV